MADNETEISDREESLDPRSGPPSGSSRRACDACHTRKIRCNKESPCAHCSRAGLTCTFTAHHPRAKRTRILLTPHYERKLDRMERRLDDVVKMLEELKHNTPENHHPPNKSAHTSDYAAPPPTENPPKLSDTSAKPTSTALSNQADSAMAAHSEFAHDFIQKTVTTDPSMSHNPEIRKAFAALKDTIRSFGPPGLPTELSYPHATPIKRPSLRGCPMPPIEKVVELIRNPNYQHVVNTAWMFQFLPHDNLSDLSLGVYFSQDYSETDFITVNAGLHYLFQAYSSMTKDNERELCLQFADMCRNNVDTGLSALPLYLPPTDGTIIALLWGIYYALDISQPHLAWTLLTKASELCQTLGYHHIEIRSEDSKGNFDRKRNFFWFLYIMDKGLSLRLGRASTIHDWDVTIPPPGLTPDHESSDQTLISTIIALSVKIARCQGDIQELLYSSASLALPDHVRHSRVQILENQLGQVDEEIRMKAEKLNPNGEVKDLELVILRSCDIAQTSLLTLVYRAAPRLEMSSIFNDQCVQSARASIRRLQNFLEMVEIENGPVPASLHNVLLYSPISFVVIFCKVIEDTNPADLACLRDFNTLLTVAVPGSGTIGKMLRLFQGLYDVALQYVEFRTASGGAEQIHGINAEMDSCLSMLGISVSNLANQQQKTDDLGQSLDFAAADSLDSNRSRWESMNPLVWMDSIFQPDDLLFW